jgi:hypothetical protein
MLVAAKMLLSEQSPREALWSAGSLLPLNQRSKATRAFRQTTEFQSKPRQAYPACAVRLD